MKTLTVHFRDLNRRRQSLSVSDDYEIKVDLDWLYTPRGIVAATEVLSAYITDEEEPESIKKAA